MIARVALLPPSDLRCFCCCRRCCLCPATLAAAAAAALRLSVRPSRQVIIVCGHYHCGAVKAALSLPSKTSSLVNCERSGLFFGLRARCGVIGCSGSTVARKESRQRRRASVHSIVCRGIAMPSHLPDLFPPLPPSPPPRTHLLKWIDKKKTYSIPYSLSVFFWLILNS